MTASHALGPNEISNVVEARFDGERVEAAAEADEVLLIVAESDEDDSACGVVEGSLDGDEGEVRWLFVDPERRGAGHGTDLFEAAVDELRERGADAVLATTLAANHEGEAFFERCGYERREDREVDVGGMELVEQVYAEEGAVSSDEAADDDVELPEDGTATADDTAVEVEREVPESGTRGPFFETYADESRDERYGYYCGNCGSTETVVDDVGRIGCGNCGNVHKPDGDQYDEGYL